MLTCHQLAQRAPARVKLFRLPLHNTPSVSLPKVVFVFRKTTLIKYILENIIIYDI
jgi:hypothetical protein